MPPIHLSLLQEVPSCKQLHLLAQRSTFMSSRQNADPQASLVVTMLRTDFPQHCHNNLMDVAVCVCFLGTRDSYLVKISQRQPSYDCAVKTSGVEGKFTDCCNYMVENGSGKCSPSKKKLLYGQKRDPVGVGR